MEELIGMWNYVVSGEIESRSDQIKIVIDIINDLVDLDGFGGDIDGEFVGEVMDFVDGVRQDGGERWEHLSGFANLDGLIELDTESVMINEGTTQSDSVDMANITDIIKKTYANHGDFSDVVDGEDILDFYSSLDEDDLAEFTELLGDDIMSKLLSDINR